LIEIHRYPDASQNLILTLIDSAREIAHHQAPKYGIGSLNIQSSVQELPMPASPEPTP
jgi:hypothetical protein